jgi:hypothetical protein
VAPSTAFVAQEVQRVVDDRAHEPSMCFHRTLFQVPKRDQSRLHSVAGQVLAAEDRLRDPVQMVEVRDDEAIELRTVFRARGNVMAA